MKTTASDISGPWHIRTANGRLPIVRERKRPHGEASTYEASIGAGDTLIGPLVCKLDFGYGYASKADMEKVTRLVAGAPELLAALRELTLQCARVDESYYADIIDVRRAAEVLIDRLDGVEVD